jgi:hypothetical protein
MADESIISRATMQKRGANAFYDWLQGYDQAADEFYHGPSAGQRVDLAQVSPV